MQYRHFSGQRDELTRRTQETEKEHYELTLELKLAEARRDDDRILQVGNRLAELKLLLAVLYREADSK